MTKPTCCWCGSAFQQVRVKQAVVWECPTAACQARQYRWALAFPGKGGKTTLAYLPVPKQVVAHEAVESRKYRRILYGGAAGGSKSHFLRWLAYRQCLIHPEFKALLLRRTYKDLERTHMRAAEGEQKILGANYIASKYLMTFPNGSLVEFGHCQDRADAQNYLSAEYDLILFDELVTFEEDMALLIMSRARTTKSDVTPMVVCGTNPGGVHARWVVDRWIDHTVDQSRYPDYDPAEYCYIKATLDDNPYLNAEYERSLADLPPELREAYRMGRWDIFPGQYFPEFRPEVHVQVLRIPEGVMRFGGLDWGYMQPGVMLWLACLPDGKIYVEEELLFTKTVPARVAEIVAAMSKAAGRRILYTKADPAMWIPSAETGEGMAETFSRAGLPLQPGNHERVNGWQRVRHWLGKDPEGRPNLLIHPSCKYLIRTLGSVVSDERRPEDVDSSGPDHAVDALRYALMSRPAPIQSLPTREKTDQMAGWLFDQARRGTEDQPLGSANVGW